MRSFLFMISVVLTLGSCAPARNYQNHKGLTFKSTDWLKDKKLERPFLITSEVSQSCSENQKKLYLPANLFKNSQIEKVYFDGMHSQTVEFVDGEKPRYRIWFDIMENQLTDFPYDLEPDQAVIIIKVLQAQKIIKIEDIRVPFYTKAGV
ncbi:hypothetical protein [Nonlabens spongiae]|nr:hypothetical protein [Nonlabens spongiae]